MPTKVLARIFGLWTLLAVFGMIATRQNTIDIVNGFFMSPALMWTAGVFSSLIGIVIVVAHNRWSGGALAIIVTLYGWIVLVKGLMFVWLPASAEQSFYNSLHFSQYFYFYFVVSLAIGAYMTYGGFRSDAAA